MTFFFSKKKRKAAGEGTDTPLSFKERTPLFPQIFFPDGQKGRGEGVVWDIFWEKLPKNKGGILANFTFSKISLDKALLLSLSRSFKIV